MTDGTKFFNCGFVRRRKAKFTLQCLGKNDLGKSDCKFRANLVFFDPNMSYHMNKPGFFNNENFSVRPPGDSYKVHTCVDWCPIQSCELVNSEVFREIFFKRHAKGLIDRVNWH